MLLADDIIQVPLSGISHWAVPTAGALPLHNQLSHIPPSMRAQVDVLLGADSTLQTAYMTPLPDDDDEGFPPPNQLATARPTAKVASARRSTPASISKQKGKAKAMPENHKRK